MRNEPRLMPIEQPSGLMLKIAYAMSKRRLGMVMTPMKVLYSRVPAMARIAYSMSQVVDRKLTLDPALRLLIQAQTSALNGCGFCLDMKHAQAVEQGIGLEKFQALTDYETSPLYDERERSALDYAREVTLRRRVPDVVFETLRTHFSEREIVEITFVNAVENFYNLAAIPLGIESDGLCAIAQQRRSAAV